MTTKRQHHAVPDVRLHDGHAMPQLGFGVWQVEDDQAADIVGRAIDAGFRAIDTARIYYNERGVGQAIRSSGIARDELFITTKLWNDAHDHDAAIAACERSLERLGLDYVDLYLIHWPTPRQDKFEEAWDALVELRERGHARSIGVSNFRIADLQRIIDRSGTRPVVNQVELHPYFQQRELKQWCAEHDIAIEAWSPLGQGGELLVDPVIAAIADETARTPAQVVIRWHLHSGHIVIPKTSTPARIAENFDVLDFELSADQMERINALDRGAAGRIGPDPAVTNFGID